MKQFNIELVRRDKVKVELDPNFSTRNGLKNSVSSFMTMKL